MFKIEGLDKLDKHLKKIANNAKKLEGEHQVPFDELFPHSFMMRYTNFSSFEELLKSGGYEVNSNEDFEAIPEAEFDNYINSVTKFSSWEEMLEKATVIWTEKNLFK